MKELFNKKIVKAIGRNSRTKESINIEREIWSWNELEFYAREECLRVLNKVELTDEELNVIIKDFNYLLNDNECKDLLDNDERRMSTYALKNIIEKQCKIYLINLYINTLDEHFLSGMAEEMAKTDVEKSLFKKLMEALTD